MEASTWVPGILSKFLHKLEVAGVPHWFRSSFRDWAGELPHIPMLEAEMVLALPPSAVGVASFMASDLFEQRPAGHAGVGRFSHRDHGASDQQIAKLGSRFSEQQPGPLSGPGTLLGSLAGTAVGFRFLFYGRWAVGPMANAGEVPECLRWGHAEPLS